MVLIPFLFYSAGSDKESDAAGFVQLLTTNKKSPTYKFSDVDMGELFGSKTSTYVFKN